MMNEDTAEDLSYDLEGLMEEFEGLSQTSFAAERPQGDGNLDNAAQVFEHNDGEWNSFDYGQHHPDWLQFLESFKSAAAYKKVVSDFLAWQHDLDEENSILERLKLYFTYVRNLKKPDGTTKYAAKRDGTFTRRMTGKRMSSLNTFLYLYSSSSSNCVN